MRFRQRQKFAQGFVFLSLLSRVFLAAHHVVVAQEPLKVVFVGKYRSGSSSLAAALRRLGYNPCHGRDVVYKATGSHSRLADALMTGNMSDILLATSDLGCNATLELHAIFFKKIVALSSSDTKYIVVIRPFDAWRRSVTNLFTEILPLHRYPLRFLPKIDKASSLFVSLAQHERGWDSREQALDVMRHPTSDQFQDSLKELYDNFVYDAHELIRSKPKETLLFDLRDGYPPLCKFLDVSDCPTANFPHLNKARDIQTELMMKRVKEFLLQAAILTVTFLPLFFVWRRRTRKFDKE